MNAINEGMRAMDINADPPGDQTAGVRLIMAGDLTTIPGSILLPGGIVLPGGLGLPSLFEINGEFVDNGELVDDDEIILGKAKAQSSKDQVVALDSKLSKTFEKIDGVFMSSQNTKLGTAPIQDTANSGAGQSIDFGSIQESIMQTKIAESSQSSIKSQKVTKSPSGSPTGNIPDGSDDDIVARQIREAAENESDPELQAKLWDEYRAYKKGISQ
ncbi:MAG: hypothetical protein IIC11_10750 [Proteobacteria bacterium]|nr:hypothetical protein [Pseudomonadota bacterium]